MQATASLPASSDAQPNRQWSRKLRPCRYFGRGQAANTVTGSSRSGPTPQVLDTRGENLQDSRPGATDQSRRRYLAAPVDETKLVKRPISKAQLADPRAYQIRQLVRRFALQDERVQSESLAFSLTPSDPDFPFDIKDGLSCVLKVPLNYPSKEPPSLQVNNEDIPRGFRVNVERGFDNLVQRMPKASLLSLINALDRNLEKFLAEERQDTIKIVRNTTVKTKEAKPPEPQSKEKPESDFSVNYSHSKQDTSNARATRELHTRQLEARMGRLPLYSKSSDGMRYTLPLTPRNRMDLPVPLQSVESADLIVPLLYPLELCRIELPDVNQEIARVLERSFAEKVKHDLKEGTLLSRFNYLNQNLHTMAVEPFKDVSNELGSLTLSSLADEEKGPAEASSRSIWTETDSKGHVIHIPRPPEWDQARRETSDNSSSGEMDSSSEEDVDEGDGNADENPPKETANMTSTSASSSSGGQHGTALSFPNLELYGIELLEVASLSLIVKCDRCKTTTEIANLKPIEDGNAQATRLESCAKCAGILSVGESILGITRDNTDIA
ncbi:MAG: hypothetical protein M1825_000570 [Sarcosagium campestre]|nr:MAG: hypothetical protein M1825_000570 [Sarcosagium campestre]